MTTPRAATPNRDRKIADAESRRDAAGAAISAILEDNATSVEFENRRVTHVDLNFLHRQYAYWDAEAKRQRALKAGYSPIVRIR